MAILISVKAAEAMTTSPPVRPAGSFDDIYRLVESESDQA
jgi:hypothetical protein